MASTDLRHIKILELLHENKKMNVTDLAKAMDVSLVTMRKDLTILESRQLLFRGQGYVEINESTPVNKRMLSNFEEKKRIAKKASELVNDNDIVFIESGSCCILLAEEIKNSGKKVTIITNSTFIADFISPFNNIKLIILGGEYQQDSMAVVGHFTKNTIENMHARLFFSGTDGYKAGKGFTGDNPERVEVLQKMSDRADKTVIITESRKFLSEGSFLLFSQDRADIVLTDDKLCDKTRKELEDSGIDVICV